MSSATAAETNGQEDAILTEFKVDDKLMQLFQGAMDNYEAEDANAEWPTNLISSKFVIYEDGLISKNYAYTTPKHRVSSKELLLCKAISQQLPARCTHQVDMGSGVGSKFGAFYITAQLKEDGTADIPSEITPALIRLKFASTIFPLATITVEPLRSNGTWWEAVLGCASIAESIKDYLEPWKDMIKAFSEHPGLRAPVFVQIGDENALDEIEESDFPEGTKITGCVMPRMPLALTERGSIVGLYGDVMLA